jgi:hypothetical protein
MTTGNQIITASFEDVLSIPLECVHATEDSIPYVYHRNGTRQVVVLGESNENKIIVEEGLEAGDQLYLSLPEEAESFKLVGEELIEKIREKERLRREEEEKREKEIKENNERGSRQMTPEMRERLMNMSEEEREQMRSNMQQQRGGGGQGS